MHFLLTATCISTCHQAIFQGVVNNDPKVFHRMKVTYQQNDEIYPNIRYPKRWVELRGRTEYPVQPPDLARLNFFCGTPQIKNISIRQSLRTVAKVYNKEHCIMCDRIRGSNGCFSNICAKFVNPIKC